MAKTFDEVVYSLCKTYADQAQLGFKSVKQVANGFEIEYVNGIKATYTVQNMHKHTNMAILNVLNKDADGDLTFNGKKITNLTADQEQLLMKFSLSADNKLLFDGKPIEGAGGTGEAYDDTELRGLINTNKTNIATNASDIVDLNTKIGTTAMGTTATDVTGAVAEVNGNLLDTVSFSADYKNIVLNRKNGTNPYTIPISAIINHAKLIELADIDTADIGNGKTLIYDAAAQKHKYVASAGTDELVKMEAAGDAHYLADLLDKQTIVNDNNKLKVKKLDGQNVTIAEINYLKGLTMNVMDLVNAFANGGVKVHNTPVATHADLTTLDRSKFIDGISYIVYVLADETHTGAKTTYLCTKTSSTYFGNADSQRNFTTDPIDLANEIKGKLGTSNIDVDSLWALLTIDDTYKTLTTADKVFGTHGAKNMYDELVAGIGNKADKDEFDTHIGDTTIHITQVEKDSYALKNEVLAVDKVQTTTGSETNDTVYCSKLTKDELNKKVNVTDFDTHKDDTVVHITSDERTKWNDAADMVKVDGDVLDYIKNNQKKNLIIYWDTTNTNTPYTAGFTESGGGTLISNIFNEKWGSVIGTCGGDFLCINRLRGGVWKGWEKLCTTTVADVPKTVITFADETSYQNYNIDGGLSFYYVQNGICYITLYFDCISPVIDYYNKLYTSDLPKAKYPIRHTISAWEFETSNSHPMTFSIDGTKGFVFGGTAGKAYVCQFSYPVAES